MDKQNAKNMKEIAEAILNQKNKTYADWLYEKHLELLAENSSTIKTALNNN